MLGARRDDGFCVRSWARAGPAPSTRRSRWCGRGWRWSPTSVGDHRKAFRTLEATATEKGKVVHALPRAPDWPCSNADDPRVLAMAGGCRGRDHHLRAHARRDHSCGVGAQLLARPAPVHRNPWRAARGRAYPILRCALDPRLSRRHCHRRRAGHPDRRAPRARSRPWSPRRAGSSRSRPAASPSSATSARRLLWSIGPALEVPPRRPRAAEDRRDRHHLGLRRPGLGGLCRRSPARRSRWPTRCSSSARRRCAAPRRAHSPEGRGAPRVPHDCATRTAICGDAGAGRPGAAQGVPAGGPPAAPGARAARAGRRAGGGPAAG